MITQCIWTSCCISWALDIHTYISCGVFTPCKNCNIETRSCDYATADKAMFSPCRAELRILLPHLLPGNSYKHLDDARVGMGQVTASAVTSCISTVTQQLKHFPRVRSRVYRRDWSSFTSQFSTGDNRGWFVVGEELIVWIEDFKCEWKTFFVCNILSVWFNGTVIIPVSRSVAGKQLVETEKS
jgi:hypothetical protein